jgi:hypothetical protein
MIIRFGTRSASIRSPNDRILRAARGLPEWEGMRIKNLTEDMAIGIFDPIGLTTKHTKKSGGT